MKFKLDKLTIIVTTFGCYKVTAHSEFGKKYEYFLDLADALAWVEKHYA